jgi:uncharacterized protein YgiM (DUF1202 family)
MTQALYQIAITTGSEDRAGTDSDVYLKIIGSSGESGWHGLDTPAHNDFEEGKTDTFDLTIDEIGYPQRLEIYMNRTVEIDDTQIQDWFLDQVVVTYAGTAIEFPYGSWITHGIGGVDKKSDPVRLYPKPGGESCRYRILLKMNDVGTDAEVRIRLLGPQGVTRFVELDTQDYNDFEAQEWSYYEVTLPDVGLPHDLDVGQVTYMKSGFFPSWIQVFYYDQTAVFDTQHKDTYPYGDWRYAALGSHPPVEAKKAADKGWEFVETFMKNMAVGLLGEMGPVGTAFGAMLFTHIITERIAQQGNSDPLAQLRETIEEALIRQDIREAVSSIDAVRDRFWIEYARARQLPSSREKLTARLLPDESQLGNAISRLTHPDVAPHALAEYLDAAILHLYLLQELASVDPDHYGEPGDSLWIQDIKERARRYRDHITATLSVILDQRAGKIAAVGLSDDSDWLTFSDAAVGGALENLDWNFLTAAGWHFQNIESDGDKGLASVAMTDSGLTFSIENTDAQTRRTLESFRDTYASWIRIDLETRLKQATAQALKTLEQVETQPIPAGIPVYPVGFDDYTVTGVETLLDIALSSYGSVQDWPQVQQWNRSFAADPLALVAASQRTISVPRQVEDLGRPAAWVAVQEDASQNPVKRTFVNTRYGYSVGLTGTGLSILDIQVDDPGWVRFPGTLAGAPLFVVAVPPGQKVNEDYAADLWQHARGAGPVSHESIQNDTAPGRTLFLLLTAQNAGQAQKLKEVAAGFKLLDPIPLSTGAAARVRTVPIEGRMDYLRLRDVPGLQAAETIENRLPNGEIVTILDGPKQVDQLVWWQVKCRDGNTGWVAEYDRNDKVLTLVRTHDINPHRAGVQALVHTTPDQAGKPVNLNLRSQPNTGADTVAKLPSGEIVKIVAGPQEGEGYVWWQLERADGTQGWSIEYTPGDTVHLLTLYALRVGLQAYVNTLRDQRGTPQRLNLRSEPGTSADIVHKLYNGDRVTLLEGPRQADGHVWWNVRCEDGTGGWAAAYIPGDFIHTIIGLHDV